MSLDKKIALQTVVGHLPANAFSVSEKEALMRAANQEKEVKVSDIIFDKINELTARITEIEDKNDKLDTLVFQYEQNTSYDNARQMRIDAGLDPDQSSRG